MKRLLLPVVACAMLASPAIARTVTLDHTVGCESASAQSRRLDLLETISRTSKMRAQGQESRVSKAAHDRAVASLTAITNSQCLKISGTYRVLEGRRFGGADILKVDYSSPEYLWVSPGRP